MKDIDFCEGVLLISPARQTAPFCLRLLYSFPTTSYKHEIAFYTKLNLHLNNNTDTHFLYYQPFFATFKRLVEVVFQCSKGTMRNNFPLFLGNFQTMHSHKSFGSQNLFVFSRLLFLNWLLLRMRRHTQTFL